MQLYTQINYSCPLWYGFSGLKVWIRTPDIRQKYTFGQLALQFFRRDELQIKNLRLLSFKVEKEMFLALHNNLKLLQKGGTKSASAIPNIGLKILAKTQGLSLYHFDNMYN